MGVPGPRVHGFGIFLSLVSVTIAGVLGSWFHLNGFMGLFLFAVEQAVFKSYQGTGFCLENLACEKLGGAS
jgi:hypothetical protein